MHKKCLNKDRMFGVRVLHKALIGNQKWRPQPGQSVIGNRKWCAQRALTKT